MSFTSLQIGISGINTARRAMEVVSENIANVNTESYSRRRVDQVVNGRLAPLTGELPREVEAGVRVAGVSRVRDPILDNAYRSQAAGVSGAHVRADVAARAEEVLGPIDSGVSDALGDFWASWERLSARPQDLAARQEVMSAGNRLATSLRAASQNLQQLETMVASRGQDVTRQINTYAEQLAKLNHQIGDAVFRGAAPNDLLDQRDALLDKIARLTTITVSQNDSGVASVYIGSFPLVDAIDAHEIVISPATGPVWGINGFPVDLSGELAAVQEATTVTLPGIQSALDEISATLQTVVNGQHRAGTDLDGNTNVDFFTGSSAADIQLSVTLTPRGVAAGLSASSADNRNALTIAQLGTAVSGGSTVNGLVDALSAQLGESAAAHEQMAGVLSSSLATLDDQRSSIQGVNLDEELADLVRYQRAYEASARVLTIADEMLDRLINRTGA